MATYNARTERVITDDGHELHCGDSALLDGAVVRYEVEHRYDDATGRTVRAHVLHASGGGVLELDTARLPSLTRPPLD